MTIQNPAIIGDDPEDELAVGALLSEMIQDERWELTDYGRAHLLEARADNPEILERLQDRDERRVSNIPNNR